MFETDISIEAIARSVMAYVVIGLLWYSPILFGKTWTKLTGISRKTLTDDRKKMWKTVGMFLGSAFVMALVYEMLSKTIMPITITDSLIVSTLVWLGLIGTTQLTDTILTGKPWKLFLINAGFQLTVLTMMGVICMTWL
jgi:hypothetical protein